MTITQTKFSLMLLLLVSSFAFFLTITFLILALFKSQVGFLTQNSSTYICSAYLTFKLSTNRVNVLNASFSGGLLALVIQALALLQLLYRLIKTFRTDRGIVKFSSEQVRRLYVYYSFGLLGTMIGTGYYLTYIVEYGVRCLEYVLSDWIILFIFIGLTFICLLVCWIYIQYIISTELQPQIEPEVTYVPFQVDSDHEKRTLGQNENEVYREMPREPSDRNSVDTHSENISRQNQMSALSEKQYPTYMAFLLDQIKKQKQNEPQIELREPLIEQVSSEDRCSEKEEREKIQFMSYEDYLKKLRKEEEQQNQFQEMIRQEEEQLSFGQSKRKNPASMVLSPFRNNFYRDFDESDYERNVKPSKPSTGQVYYPANFVPSNEQQRKKFEAYKKQLLKRSKKGKIDGKLKHPQNIEGGRSKRSIREYLAQSKRPLRNESTLRVGMNNYSSYESKLPGSERSEFTPKDQQSSESSSKSQFPQKKEDELPVVEVTPPPRPIQIQQSIEREPESDQLHFHKEKLPNRQRKQLFSPTYNEMTVDQAISTLVKGIEQNEMKSKLRQIRDRRNSNISAFRGKKGQRLIQAIRSTYQ